MGWGVSFWGGRSGESKETRQGGESKERPQGGESKETLQGGGGGAPPLLGTEASRWVSARGRWAGGVWGTRAAVVGEAVARLGEGCRTRRAALCEVRVFRICGVQLR